MMHQEDRAPWGQRPPPRFGFWLLYRVKEAQENISRMQRDNWANVKAAWVLQSLLMLSMALWLCFL